MSAEIIKFPVQDFTQPAASNTAPTSESSEVRVVQGTDLRPLSNFVRVGSPSTTTPEDLYPDPTVSPILTRVMELLRECITQMDAAESATDTLSADDAVMHVQTLLPELFAGRALGEGIASVIVAVFYALQNLRGQPMTREQIIEVRWCLKRLHKEPFLLFSDALGLIIALDSKGLKTEPPALAIVQDLLLAENESGVLAGSS
jgi:hypothetical protein